MADGLCHETMLTVFANLTPWVQVITVITVGLTMVSVGYWLMRVLVRRQPIELLHYVAHDDKKTG